MWLRTRLEQVEHKSCVMYIPKVSHVDKSLRFGFAGGVYGLAFERDDGCEKAVIWRVEEEEEEEEECVKGERDRQRGDVFCISYL